MTVPPADCTASVGGCICRVGDEGHRRGRIGSSARDRWRVRGNGDRGPREERGRHRRQAPARWVGWVRHPADLPEGYHAAPRRQAWQPRPAVSRDAAPESRVVGRCQDDGMPHGSQRARTVSASAPSSDVGARSGARSERSPIGAARTRREPVDGFRIGAVCGPSQRTKQRSTTRYDTDQRRVISAGQRRS